MSNDERREVSLEEAKELYESGKVAVGDFQVSAVCVIKDKDGNVKSTFEASTDYLHGDDNET